MEGQPNVYTIRSRQVAARDDAAEITTEEWDKFERDIADAFEQIP